MDPAYAIFFDGISDERFSGKQTLTQTYQPLHSATRLERNKSQKHFCEGKIGPQHSLITHTGGPWENVEQRHLTQLG